MRSFFALLKINIKLLLRNKAFIFFLLITPVISVFILGLKTETASQQFPRSSTWNRLSLRCFRMDLALTI